ncbi:glycosyltransferase family 1 protein [bacterium]|nr:glycosyltransferase family 1 protein [bacterium]
MEKPKVLIFFNDWPVYPSGANCGGGETATISLAEAFAQRGFETIACGDLPNGETVVRGVQYWDFGQDYGVHRLRNRIQELGSYYAIAATLVHPFLVLGDDPQCLKKILINHSPGVNPSGLESSTVMHMVDHFVCVSEAQKEIVLARGDVPEERIHVIQNGFDPERFVYAGPENRDWNQLMYAGRLEYSKGIHLLLNAFLNLKQKFPRLSLDVYGDASFWPQLQEQIEDLQSSHPGLVFHGKVPQQEIATQLQRAGCLVFPSLSFESAGLSVLDAQASGCPVIASDVGGVREYLNPSAGVLVPDISHESLQSALERVLSNTDSLSEMSRKGALVREQTWDAVARSIAQLFSTPTARLSTDVPVAEDSSSSADHIIEVTQQSPVFMRSWRSNQFSVEQVLADHEVISAGSAISDTQLFELTPDTHGLVHLWKGLRLDAQDRKQEAYEEMKRAYSRRTKDDWQSLFYLTLISVDLEEIPEAKSYAQQLLNEFPDFPLKGDLERFVDKASLCLEARS